MTKMKLVPLVLAIAAISACTPGIGISSAGGPDGPGQSVELASGGLTTGSVGLHHSTTIDFGTPRAQVLALLRPALGAPTAGGRNADCPSGPVDFVSYGPVDLHFEDGKFSGWVIDEAGKPDLQSYHGLSFGDRRSDFDGDVEINVMADSSLGTELSVNGIGVLMSGPGGSGQVTNLFAGTTCFAR